MGTSRGRAARSPTSARTPDADVRPYHHVVPPLAPRGRVAMTRDELVEWGESLGPAAAAPLLITLAGDLCAWNKTLAQAICVAAGVSDPLTSPSTESVNRYDATSSPVYHRDHARLWRPSDLVNIGGDDIVSAHAVFSVESPER